MVKNRIILTTIILFVSYSLCFAAYDNSNVEIRSAGRGYFADSASRIVGDRTLGDKEHPFLEGGTLSRIKMRCWDGGTNTTIMKFKILRGAGSPYTLVGEIDATAHFVAWQSTVSAYAAYDTSATYNSVTLDVVGANITVVAGDFLAVYYDSGNSVQPTAPANTGYNCIYNWHESLALSITMANTSLAFDAWVQNNEYIALDDTAIYHDSDEIKIPFYSSENQYIVIEDIAVPDMKDVQIAFNYTDATTGADTTAFTVNLSFDGAGDDDDKIALFTGTLFDDTYSKSIAGQEFFRTPLPGFHPTNHITIYLHLDVSTDKMELIFVNYDTGQGGQGDADVRHTSITDRVPIATGIDLSDTQIKRITITNSGGDVFINDVIVCRKPVLAVGDSYISGYFYSQPNGYKNFFTSLAGIGTKLGAAFSEERYVINGGISGSRVNQDAIGYHTSILKRWDGDDRDLCAFRDVVVALVNGPGLNDAQMIFGDANARPWRIAGANGGIVKMVADVLSDLDEYGAANDVVMCELIPIETGWVFTDQGIVDLNNAINYASHLYQVPLAKTFNYPFGYEEEDGSGLHPDSYGQVFIAAKIAQAYENNLVNYSNTADITGDGKVDMFDLSELANQWLSGF